MRILLVGNYFYPEHRGGIETVSYNLVKYFQEAGHKIRWVAADVPPVFRMVSEEDIPIRAWNIAEERLGFPSPIPYPNTLIRLFKGVKWCDVVHLHDSLYLISMLVFFMSKSLSKPILITQHAKYIPYTQFYKRALQTIAYGTVGRLMFNHVAKVVFVTSTVRDTMRSYCGETQEEVVPNGIDTDFYAPLSLSERRLVRAELWGDSTIPIILFVGRLVERKGVHLIRPLIEKHREWHWIFVGRPDDFNPQEWHLPNLKYFQDVSDTQLRRLYASADLLVHPSVGEGITLIALESMASGTPVVISDESLYGLKASERNLFFGVKLDTNSIEEALRHALSDPQKLERLRTRCREYTLNHLSWKKVAERYLSILSTLRNPNQ
jgi:glycosyltransferase involved in cell wall biosynthesis